MVLAHLLHANTALFIAPVLVAVATVLLTGRLEGDDDSTE